MTAVINPTPRAVADVTSGVIHASVEIAAPPERVFRALTDGGEVVRWWGSTDTYRLQEFTADLRVGGQWRSRGVAADGKPFQVTGEFLTIDAPHLLVQTWTPDWAPGLKTTLTYRLDAIPGGGTRLTLRHEGFGAHREAFEGHTRGWEIVLGFLAKFLVAPAGRGIVARYFNPLRLAAYVLVLFCLGHSLGALVNTPSFGAESDAVWAAMRATHFRCQTSDCTWFGFYEGFGWMVSVFFLLSAALAWVLGGLDRPTLRRLAPLVWALCLSQLACTVLSFQWFFLAPQLFGIAATILLAVPCFRLRA